MIGPFSFVTPGRHLKSNAIKPTLKFTFVEERLTTYCSHGLKTFFFRYRYVFFVSNAYFLLEYYIYVKFF